MLRDGVEYQDLGVDYFDQRDKAKTINRLVRRLHELGVDVKLPPAASGSANSISGPAARAEA
jgi:hypothetical protein